MGAYHSMAPGVRSSGAKSGEIYARLYFSGRNVLLWSRLFSYHEQEGSSNHHNLSVLHTIVPKLPKINASLHSSFFKPTEFLKFRHFLAKT